MEACTPENRIQMWQMATYRELEFLLFVLVTKWEIYDRRKTRER